MNWLTLFACSAAGATGAVDANEHQIATPAVAISQAADETAEEAKINGAFEARPGGGYVALTMEGVNVVLRFYDENKKPVAPDVDRAFVRLQHTTREEDRLTLIPTEDGMALRVGRPVQKPHIFRAFVSLFRGDSAESVESHQLVFPPKE